MTTHLTDQVLGKQIEKKLFESLSVDNLLLADNPCKSEGIRKTKEKLIANDKESWLNYLLSNGRDHWHSVNNI